MAQFQLAADFFAQNENLRISCHAVERIPSAQRGRAAQLVPIRFVFSGRPTRHDKLLLAFEALVISKVLGREVTLGRIVYGDDHFTLNVKVSALADDGGNDHAKSAHVISGSRRKSEIKVAKESYAFLR